MPDRKERGSAPPAARPSTDLHTEERAPRERRSRSLKLTPSRRVMWRLLAIGAIVVICGGWWLVERRPSYEPTTPTEDAATATPQAPPPFQDDEARLLLQGQRPSMLRPLSGRSSGPPAASPQSARALSPGGLDDGADSDRRICMALKHRHPVVLTMNDRAVISGPCAHAGLTYD